MKLDASAAPALWGRSLTGAWIETVCGRNNVSRPPVAPLRGRGLKRAIPVDIRNRGVVAPLRGRGLKHAFAVHDLFDQRRSLTGAWIETPPNLHTSSRIAVAPLRGRGLKHARDHAGGRVWDRRSLTGAWIETRRTRASQIGPHSSLPYGGVD